MGILLAIIIINIYYTKIELNEILTKKEQQVNDNSKSLINYVSNKNNNELYYLKHQILNKDETHDILNTITNKISNKNNNELYYFKNNVYNKNEINKITNKLINFISNH